MKFITNKKLIWAVALIAGAALAGMGAYSVYTSDDEVATASAGEMVQSSNGINTVANESAGVLNKLQAWVSGWGVNPFSEGDVTIIGGEPINGSISKNPRDSMIMLEAEFNNSNWTCSGTFIAPDVILTAAHCVVKDGLSVNTSDITIRHYKNGVLQRLKGNQIIAFETHPKYTSITSYKYDLALLKVNNTAMSSEIIPNAIIQLDDTITNEENKNLRVIIGGFGVNEDMPRGGVSIFRPKYSEAGEVKTLLANTSDMNRIKNSPRYAGMHILKGAWMLDLMTSLPVPNPALANMCKGDSGGAIESVVNKRQFGVASVNAVDDSPLTQRRPAWWDDCYAIASLYAPLDRLWIDNTVKDWGSDQGRCYPNWPDTKPRDPKTKKCDTRTSGTVEQSEKGNGVAENSTGLNNIPLPKCSAADLRRMALWNREHSTAALTAAAAAEYKRLHTDPWQARYDREYNRLMSEQSSGGGSSNSSYNLTIIDIRARAAAGAQPASFVYTGPLGSAIDLAQCIEDVYMQLPSGDDTCSKAYRSWFMFVTINNLPATNFNAGCSEALFSGRQQLGTSREWRNSIWDEFYLFLNNVRSSGYGNASSSTSSNNTQTADLTFKPLMTDQTPGRLQGTWIWQINWFSNGQWTSRRCDIPVDIARYPTSTQFNNYVSANCPRP